MDIDKATNSFAALSQPSRLAALRLLVQAGAQGLSAGDISAALDVRQNTMSTNLSILTQSGLIKNQRQGRSIRYFVDWDGLSGLLGFLMQDCCGGQPEICQRVITEISCCSTPRKPE